MEVKYSYLDLYNPKSEVYQAHLLPDEGKDLKSILARTEEKWKESEVSKKTLGNKIEWLLHMALVQGSEHYIIEAQAVNVVAKMRFKLEMFCDDRITAVQSCFLSELEFNVNWTRQALVIIDELKDLEEGAPYSILKEKINLACRTQLAPFKGCSSYKQIRKKLMKISHSNSLECYRYVLAIQQLTDKYKFVHLGKLSGCSLEEYNFLIKKAKKCLESEFNLEKWYKIANLLIEAGVMTCSKKPFLNWAETLVNKAGMALGCEAKLLEVKELFRTKKFNLDWKAEALFYATAEKGSVKIVKAISAGLPGFESNASFADVINYLCLPTLDSAWQRYKTTQRLNEFSAPKKKKRGRSKSEKMEKKKETKLVGRGRGHSTEGGLLRFVPHFTSRKFDVCEFFSKLSLRSGLHESLDVEQLELSKTKFKWENFIETEYKKRKEGDALENFAKTHVGNLKNLLFLSVYTGKRIWMEICNSYYEALLRFNPQNQRVSPRGGTYLRCLNDELASSEGAEESYWSILKEADQIFKTGISFTWRESLKKHLLEIEIFLQKETDSEFKVRIKEGLARKVFGQYSTLIDLYNLLNNTNLQLTFEQYFAVQLLNKLRSGDLIFYDEHSFGESSSRIVFYEQTAQTVFVKSSEASSSYAKYPLLKDIGLVDAYIKNLLTKSEGVREVICLHLRELFQVELTTEELLASFSDKEEKEAEGQTNRDILNECLIPLYQMSPHLFFEQKIAVAEHKLINVCLERLADEDTLAKAAVYMCKNSGDFFSGSEIRTLLQAGQIMHEHMMDLPTLLMNLTEFFKQEDKNSDKEN